LDPEERIRFRTLLAELGGDRIVILSTHIVEDIAQTCRYLALMRSGQVLFRGTIAELVEAARGKVWTLATSGAKPAGDATVISMQHFGDSVQYRLVSEATPGSGAQAVEPTLEDSYVWFMRDRQAPRKAALV
ncbi:MAG TPA: ABC transporter ATP-binding protein, partial [Ktedonobacterales bacterium]|nr:ABC transporter ATP-binding protein [Ktedonobacterales bacterium]